MVRINREIKSILESRRDKAMADLDQRKAEVLARIPELAALEQEITLEGIRHARTLTSNDSVMADTEAFAGRITALEQEKENLLVRNGYPADFLEPRFTCPVCGDTGLVTDKDSLETRPCACYRQLYLEKLYQVSNILDDGNTGFRHFDETLYSDKPDPKRYGSDISPREQILAVRDRCLSFIENFSEPTPANLYFYGAVGTGKTFMAKATGLELINRGYTVLYLSAPTLFEVIRKARFSSDDDELDATYRDLVETQLLILDDLGTEPASDARYAELLTLLEARKTRASRFTARTIISSNLDLKQLYQAYNERIASRILGEFEPIKFFGEDIRILKKYG
ncbi:MAG TPA: ATP-binding protein [Thermoclostridium sp.]|nr:ATP-binding protein [Thermoclostridium sp.]HPU45674.1 ATP-binding protein [Thermoclostridium sp.]